LYFLANLSKTLRTNFHQNRSSIVQGMIKNLVCFMPHRFTVYTWHISANYTYKIYCSEDQVIVRLWCLA